MLRYRPELHLRVWTPRPPSIRSSCQHGARLALQIVSRLQQAPLRLSLNLPLERMKVSWQVQFLRQSWVEQPLRRPPGLQLSQELVLARQEALPLTLLP